MGWYTTLRHYTRQPKGGGKEIIPPGKRIYIEIRSEAEAALKSGCVTKKKLADIPGLTKLDYDREATEPNERRKKSKYSPQEIETANRLGKALGLPQEGAMAKLQQHLADNDLEQAEYLVMKAAGMLSDEDLIADFADDHSLDAAELQVEFYEQKKETGLKIGRLLTLHGLARELERGSEEIIRHYRDLTKDGLLSPRMAIEKIRAELVKEAAEDEDHGLPEEPAPNKAESQPEPPKKEIEVGDAVKVISEESKYLGLQGEVIRITKGGVLYVALENDPNPHAKYHRFDDDLVELIA